MDCHDHKTTGNNQIRINNGISPPTSSSSPRSSSNPQNLRLPPSQGRSRQVKPNQIYDNACLTASDSFRFRAWDFRF